MHSHSHHGLVTPRVGVEPHALGDLGNGLPPNDPGKGRMDLGGGEVAPCGHQPEQVVSALRFQEAQLGAFRVREGGGGGARQKGESARDEGGSGRVSR